MHLSVFPQCFASTFQHAMQWKMHCHSDNYMRTLPWRLCQKQYYKKMQKIQTQNAYNGNSTKKDSFRVLRKIWKYQNTKVKKYKNAKVKCTFSENCSGKWTTRRQLAGFCQTSPQLMAAYKYFLLTLDQNQNFWFRFKHFDSDSTDLIWIQGRVTC